MNWTVGLKRLSALACGFVVLAFLFGIFDMAQSSSASEIHLKLFGMGVMVIVCGFLAHKAICWLIDGFGDRKASS